MPTDPLPILILKTGDTLPSLRDRHGDFEDWIRAGLVLAGGRTVVFDARTGRDWPLPGRFAAVVVTGSPAMVTDREPWAEQSVAWLREAVAAERPVLGICYGHQLLAHALGGRIGELAGGPEVGTVTVERTAESDADPLLRGLPWRFEVQASHRQSVHRLPAGAVRLAGNAAEAHHAFRAGHRAWGLQFHPEFDPEITRAYVDHQAPLLVAQGREPAPVRAAVADTPVAARLLPRFAALAMAWAAGKT